MTGIALIIGANGVLGKELSRQLAKIYYTIGTSREQETLCSQTIYTKDLSVESCTDICNKVKQMSINTGKAVDIIVYNAGFGYSEDLLTDEITEEMFQVNVYGATAIAKVFSKVKFVYISSCTVLGTTGRVGLETYSKTKKRAEELLGNICNNLSFVRPTILGDTQFAERAKLKPFSSNDFMDASEVASYIISHLDKTWILPGWQAKMLHVLNSISPKLAQKFLQV